MAGLIAGYLIARETLKHGYERLAQEEIDDVKKHYKLLRKEEYETPGQALAKRYGETLDDLEYITPEEKERNAQEIEDMMTKGHKPLFDLEPPGVAIPARDDDPRYTEFNPETDEEWQWLIKDRDPDIPYIISVDEFMMEREEFDKETLSYFEEDDTLVDMSDRPIDDPDAIVGDDSLLRFGKASRDRNIVYVRNERISTDFEITRNKRSFTEVVLGLKDDEGELPRFREDD